MTVQPDAQNAKGALAGALAESNRDKQHRIDKPGIRDWQDVDLLTERLLLIADYEDHLRLKIRWAQLRMELGMDVVEIDDLVEEVQDFRNVCAALSAPSDGRSAA